MFLLSGCCPAVARLLSSCCPAVVQLLDPHWQHMKHATCPTDVLGPSSRDWILVRPASRAVALYQTAWSLPHALSVLMFPVHLQQHPDWFSVHLQQRPRRSALLSATLTSTMIVTASFTQLSHICSLLPLECSRRDHDYRVIDDLAFPLYQQHWAVRKCTPHEEHCSGRPWLWH